MKQDVDIIGVQMDWGASKRGACMGPAAIRFGGLREGLEQLGYSVWDKEDILSPMTGTEKGNLRHCEQVTEVNRRPFQSVTETLEAKHFPIVLGGDHSIAAGSISAVSKHFDGHIGVIWIDAHGDWNDETSSPSGNMHGMPFSAVCGWGPECMVEYGQGAIHVDPRHCVQIGGRDLDNEERRRMKQAGIQVFPINLEPIRK